MKKSIIALSLLAFVSCKKDTPAPTPEPTPTPVTVNYSLELLAYDNSSDGTFYTNLKVVINGDTLSSLSSHTTARTYQDIEGEFHDAGTAYPTNGISYPFVVGTVYTIKVLDGPTNTLLHTTVGKFEAEPQPTVYDRDIFFHLTSETDNTAGADAVFGAGNWNIYEGMGEGNLNTKYFFVFGIQL